MDSKSIKDKISANEEKIAKKENTVIKLQKQLDKANKDFKKIFGDTLEDFKGEKTLGSDEKNEYLDIKYTIEDLEERIDSNLDAIDDLNRILQGWKEKLADAEEKENRRAKNDVIMDFLNNWASNSFDFLITKYDSYKKALHEFEDYRKTHKMSYRDSINYEDDFKHKWGIMYKLYSPDKGEFKEKVLKFLDNEKEKKYDDFIIKIENYVGDITSTEYLDIADNGDLNGIVEGTKGKAEVYTFGAGGYNIQRFHYRVSIKKR